MSKEAYLAAILETYQPRAQRKVERLAADMKAGVRPRGSTRIPVRVVDLSTHGCGFRARCSIGTGGPAWLCIPGLENWEGKIVWCDDERGGMEFARPLHPSVVSRLTSEMDTPTAPVRKAPASKKP